MKLQITITYDPILIHEKTITFTINDSKPIQIGSMIEVMYCEYIECSIAYKTRLIAEVTNIEIYDGASRTALHITAIIQEIIKHESYEPELQPDRVLEEVGNYINFYEDEIIKVLD